MTCFWHYESYCLSTHTLFKNHPKCRIFQNLAKLTIFGIFNELFSTQNVNVAHFARNVECDFLGDFQTLCTHDFHVLFVSDKKGWSTKQHVCHTLQFSWIIKSNLRICKLMDFYDFEKKRKSYTGSTIKKLCNIPKLIKVRWNWD